MMETNLKLKMARRLQNLAGSVLACFALWIMLPNASAFSLGASQTFDIHGNNLFSDSFDSADPNYSIEGLYPFGYLNRTKANGDFCTGSGLVDSLGVGNVTIKGSVRTGSGTYPIDIGPNGSVGDRAWVEGGSLGIQPGHSSTDFNTNFPSAVLPAGPWIPLFSGSFPWTNGVTYGYVITTGGQWSLPGLSTNLLVNAPRNSFVNIFIRGNVGLSGNQVITVAPTDAKVRIYMGGSTFHLSGNAVIDNQGGLTRDFCLYGLPSCASIWFGGNDEFCGEVYAPQADLVLGGGSNAGYEFVGSAVIRTVTMNGHFNFHFDEDLDRNPVFPPRILAQPQSQAVLVGSNAAFGVTVQWATGLQWLLAGTNIIGATNATLVLTNVGLSDAGAYSVVLSNSTCSVTSSVATLTVYTTAAGILSSPANGTNTLQFGVAGVPGLRYAIEASTNLTDWSPLTTNIVPFNFEDLDVTNFEHRYYRSVWLP